MSRSNGTQPEVIVNFADGQNGFSYAKGRLEDAFQPGGVLEKAPTKPTRDPALAQLKKDDVELIVHEFEIPRAQAEKALLENGGDLDKTLRALVAPISKP